MNFHAGNVGDHLALLKVHHNHLELYLLCKNSNMFSNVINLNECCNKYITLLFSFKFCHILLLRREMLYRIITG